MASIALQDLLELADVYVRPGLDIELIDSAGDVIRITLKDDTNLEVQYQPKISHLCTSISCLWGMSWCEDAYHDLGVDPYARDWKITSDTFKQIESLQKWLDRAASEMGPYKKQ